MNKSININQLALLFLTSVLVSFSFKIQDVKSNEFSTIITLTERENSFTIKNISDISIPIKTIDKVHKFESNEKSGGFRCVTTGSLGATDYGPYNELYFIFDNGYEMPHRTAVFKIGNLAKILSFKKVSESNYQITGVMFSNEKYESNERVIITIDATMVLEKEKKFIFDNTDIEGDFESEISVSITNLR